MLLVQIDVCVGCTIHERAARVQIPLSFLSGNLVSSHPQKLIQHFRVSRSIPCPGCQPVLVSHLCALHSTRSVHLHSPSVDLLPCLPFLLLCMVSPLVTGSLICLDHLHSPSLLGSSLLSFSLWVNFTFFFTRSASLFPFPLSLMAHGWPASH